MVERINNSGELLNEAYVIEEFADKNESKSLSDSVSELRKNADTSAVVKKEPLIKNSEAKFDIIESGDNGLSLFDDEVNTKTAVIMPEDHESVVQEQKSILNQKKDSGELLKFDDSAVELASDYVENQFSEDTKIQDSLKNNGLLEIPEDEAANIIMQSAEILGEVETPGSNTRMNFVEDVDTLLSAKTLNERNVEDTLSNSDLILEQSKLELKERDLGTDDSSEDVSEIEQEIIQEEKTETIKKIKVSGDIESLEGERSVAQSDLSSNKSKLGGLGGDVDLIIDSAIATSSVDLNTDDKSKGDRNNDLKDQIKNNIISNETELNAIDSQISSLEADLET